MIIVAAAATVVAATIAAISLSMPVTIAVVFPSLREARNEEATQHR